ncbi:MAG: hypothetical protein RMJ19_00745 [Gemmatales bacterium]|nr:hypothetical protein [Gemmatales bacterium]MDW8174172.1 hypothetical protein [Gemmatales bacterium]
MCIYDRQREKEIFWVRLDHNEDSFFYWCHYLGDGPVAVAQTFLLQDQPCLTPSLALWNLATFRVLIEYPPDTSDYYLGQLRLSPSAERIAIQFIRQPKCDGGLLYVADIPPDWHKLVERNR